MKKCYIAKLFPYFIIFLFIGVSIQPVFANNLKYNDNLIDFESRNNDKSKYVVEIVREDKIIKHSVFLTKEQANDLDSIIDETHTKLDCSKSYEDTAQIFYDTADSLNVLDIFPDNIGINEIKSLVTGESRDLNKIKFKSKMVDGFENRLCFVASNTTESLSFGPIVLATILAFIPLFVYALFLDKLVDLGLYNFPILKILLLTPYYILQIPAFALLNFSLNCIFSRQPVSIGSFVTYGCHIVPLDPYGYDEYYPSNGWIYTVGLNGIKSYDGLFYGNLLKIWALLIDWPSGVTGFTGISIRKPDDYVFRLGFGLHAKIDSEY